MDAIIAFFASLKGYRTFIVNGILSVVGALIALGVIPASQAAGWAPEQVQANFDAILGAFIVLVGAVNAVLRIFTTTPATKAAPVVPAVAG